MKYERKKEKERKAQGAMARRRQNRKGFANDGSGEVEAVSANTNT